MHDRLFDGSGEAWCFLGIFFYRFSRTCLKLGPSVRSPW